MINGKSSIVILTPGFPSSESDTTCLPMQQQFVEKLAEMYAPNQVIVLSFQYPYTRKKYTWRGINIESFNGRNRGGLARQWLRRGIARRLAEIHARHPVSMLLSFWCGECAWVGKRFGDANGIAHRCWIMGQDARSKNPYPRKMKPRAGELIAISDFISDEFERNHGTRPTSVVTPGVDERLWMAPCEPKDIDIMGAGSLIPLKRFDWFLETIASMRQVQPGLKAVLVGDGPERKRLERIAGALRLGDSVQFAGECPYPQVLQYMRRSRLFLHPSSFEGFSGVCLEALASGCHVIGTSCPLNETIPGWTVALTKEELPALCLHVLESGKAGPGLSPKYRIENSVVNITGGLVPPAYQTGERKMQLFNHPS